ncbi:MAG: hypothetical protein HYV26_10865 [Candidatus Hydrogenedentes bacterium]|nr:hypothetical protein [Candidatus Hydrogenedentota bacterium]
MVLPILLATFTSVLAAALLIALAIYLLNKLTTDPRYWTTVGKKHLLAACAAAAFLLLLMRSAIGGCVP